MELLRDLLRLWNHGASSLFKTRFYEPLGIGYLGQATTMGFQSVLEGEVLIRASDMTPPVRLGRGDLIFYVRNFDHDVAFDPLTPVRLRPRSFPMPTVVGRGGHCLASILNGGYTFTDGPPHPIMADLPPYLVVRAEEMRGNRSLLAAIAMVAAELNDRDTIEDEDLRTLLLALVFHYVLTHWLQHHALAAPWGVVLDDHEMYRALRAVHERPEADWTVATLAREVGMGRTVFAQRFKERVGMAPAHYVSRVRSQRAAVLLRSTDRSIEDIASATGYADQFGFSKAFKRLYGMSPRVYRRAVPSLDVEGRTPSDPISATRVAARGRRKSGFSSAKA